MLLHSPARVPRMYLLLRIQLYRAELIRLWWRTETAFV